MGNWVADEVLYQARVHPETTCSALSRAQADALWTALRSVIATACELAEHLAGKYPTAWARTKKRFREVALKGFEEAFRAGVLGQQAAFANGEPQAFIDEFMAKKGG